MEPIPNGVTAILQYGALGLVVVMVLAFLVMMRSLMSGLEKHANATTALATAISNNDKAAVDRHHSSTTTIVDKLQGHMSALTDEVREQGETAREAVNTSSDKIIDEVRETREALGASLTTLLVKIGATPPTRVPRPFK